MLHSNKLQVEASSVTSATVEVSDFPPYSLSILSARTSLCGTHTRIIHVVGGAIETAMRVTREVTGGVIPAESELQAG